MFQNLNRFLASKGICWFVPRGTVRLNYYTASLNFGDVLNENLMAFFHQPFVKVRSKHAEMTCIGSLLQNFLLKRHKHRTKKPMYIFGTGFIQPASSDSEAFCRPMVFCAIRGKLSKERCAKITGENLDHVPLGDPALLTKRMFPDMTPNPQYDVGVICHYVDKESPCLKNIQLKNLRVRYIDVMQRPEDFVGQVLSCKFILSSAMHGLICADSFGIPNRHIVLSENVVGGEYKFRDYYSVFDGVTYNPIYLKDRIITDEDIVQFTKEYAIKQAQVDAICDRLIGAFPNIKQK